MRNKLFIINVVFLSVVAAEIRNVSVNGSDSNGDGTESSPFATIQAGINKSLSSDTVLVGPGTYNQQIDYKGKQIIVMSTSGADSTVIYSTNNNVSFNTQEGSSAVLDGFTLTGSSEYGIYMDSYSKPTLRNLVI